jgi:hypothetical protein
VVKHKLSTAEARTIKIINQSRDALWTGLFVFVGSPDRDDVAQAIRDEARKTRDAATLETERAEAGDDLPAAGGCPSRGEIAGGLLERAEYLEKLAAEVLADKHSIVTYATTPVVIVERDTSVLQEWVADLGLRHQGVLMSCIRGCDNVPKEDATKLLARCLRAAVLRSFDERPTSFIEHVDFAELRLRMVAVLQNHDHYPVHYLMHLMHGAEIIGYKHPNEEIARRWRWFYTKLAQCFHLFPETGYDLEIRLGADEDTFAEKARIE